MQSPAHPSKRRPRSASKECGINPCLTPQANACPSIPPFRPALFPFRVRCVFHASWRGEVSAFYPAKPLFEKRLRWPQVKSADHPSHESTTVGSHTPRRFREARLAPARSSPYMRADILWCMRSSPGNESRKARSRDREAGSSGPFWVNVGQNPVMIFAIRTFKRLGRNTNSSQGEAMMAPSRAGWRRRRR